MVICQKNFPPMPKRRALKLNGTSLNSQFLSLRLSKKHCVGPAASHFSTAGVR
jgi:hypothetical protein